jgi:hypothetical protein
VWPSRELWDHSPSDTVGYLAKAAEAAEELHRHRPASSTHHGLARVSRNLGLVRVRAVRAAKDAEPYPDGACRLAPSPGPVSGMVLTLPAVIGAVAARIPIRIHQRLRAPSRDERRNMYRRVRVVDTLLVLVHGP